MMYRMSGHLCDVLLTPCRSAAEIEKELRQSDAGVSAIMSTESGIGADNASAAKVSQFYNRPLSGKELRLLIAISSILAERSQHSDQKAEDFYCGEEDPEIRECRTDSGAISLKAPVINVTLYQLARAFYPDRKIGGANTAAIKSMLFDEQSGLLQSGVIRYNRLERQSKRSKILQTLTDNSPLIAVEPIDDDSGSAMSKDGQFTIICHPVFIDSIRKKYIQLSTDLIKQIDSAGHSKESSITYLMILELLRAHSNRKVLEKNDVGNRLFTIGKDKLLQHVTRQYCDPESGKIDRPSRIDNMLNHAIAIAKRIGLIHDHSIRSGRIDDALFTFELNASYGTNG